MACAHSIPYVINMDYENLSIGDLYKNKLVYSDCQILANTLKQKLINGNIKCISDVKKSITDNKLFDTHKTKRIYNKELFDIFSENKKMYKIGIMEINFKKLVYKKKLKILFIPFIINGLYC